MLYRLAQEFSRLSIAIPFRVDGSRLPSSVTIVFILMATQGLTYLGVLSRTIQYPSNPVPSLILLITPSMIVDGCSLLECAVEGLPPPYLRSALTLVPLVTSLSAHYDRSTLPLLICFPICCETALIDV